MAFHIASGPLLHRWLVPRAAQAPLVSRNDTQRMPLKTVAIVIEPKGNPCARKWNVMLIGGTRDTDVNEVPWLTDYDAYH